MGWRSRIKQGLRRLIGGEDEEPQSSEPPKPAEEDGFVSVLPGSRLASGSGLTVARKGEMVAVFRTAEGLFAVDDACVHEDGPLGEGEVDGATVTCPYHDWRYELSTGACLSEPNRAVGCFAIREHAGWIQVGPRKSASSEERGGSHDDGLEEIPLNDDP